MMKQYYIDRIKSAESIEELDEIIESAAASDDITHAEYCEVYEVALKVAQELIF